MAQPVYTSVCILVTPPLPCRRRRPSVGPGNRSGWLATLAVTGAAAGRSDGGAAGAARRPQHSPARLPVNAVHPQPACRPCSAAAGLERPVPCDSGTSQRGSWAGSSSGCADAEQWAVGFNARPLTGSRMPDGRRQPPTHKTRPPSHLGRSFRPSHPKLHWASRGLSSMRGLKTRQRWRQSPSSASWQPLAG